MDVADQRTVVTVVRKDQHVSSLFDGPRGACSLRIASLDGLVDIDVLLG
jgi:hypothetical protein